MSTAVSDHTKMLLITPLLPPPVRGGSGVLLRELFSRFPKDEVIALVGRLEQEDGITIDGNMEVHRRKKLHFPLSRFNMITFLAHFTWEAFSLQKLKKLSFLVCGEYYPCSIVALALYLFKGVPYFVYFHGEDIYKMYRWRKWLIKPILLHAKGVISNSEYTKRLIINRGGNGKIIVCKPCADYHRFKPSSNVDKLKRELGLENKKIILTVSRIIPRKGHKHAILALKSIINTYSNAILVIVGKNVYGYGAILQEYIKKCKVEENVFIKGDVTDEELVKYYQVCDIFVMVSDTGPDQNDLEGFGITFLEASACEKPVIGGNSGGMPEAVEDGVTGFIIDPNNENVFIEKLERLLGDPLEVIKWGGKEEKE